MLFGNAKYKPFADLAKNAIRNPSNFNWTFIALFAVVVVIYATEYKKKNYNGIAAALGLYCVHWFYEIINAIIGSASGYALWTVSPASTTFMLLIGVGWELSMMFAIAGFTTSILPEDKNAKMFGINNRLLFVIGNTLMFSIFEIFLAWTPAFIWVYPWWGTILVGLTVYAPFFIACIKMFDAKPKTRKIFIGSMFALDALLLIILIPLGIV